MRKNPFFCPDSSNPGGKVILENLKKNHVEAVLNTKPITKSFNAPHPHVDALTKSKKGFKSKLYNTFDVSKIPGPFKLNATRKAITDSSTPLSHYYRRDISKLNSSEKNYTMHDHVRNVKCLVNRLAEIDVKANRKLSELKIKIKSEKKKKKMQRILENSRPHHPPSPMGFVLSPEAYTKFKPVQKKGAQACYDFFEINNTGTPEEGTTEGDETTEGQQSKRAYERDYASPNSSHGRLNAKLRPQSSKPAYYHSEGQKKITRSISAKGIDKNMWNIPEVDFKIPVVSSDRGEEQSLQELRRKVLETVVGKRLIDKEKLKILRELVIDYNRKLNKEKINEIFDDLENYILK